MQRVDLESLSDAWSVTIAGLVGVEEKPSRLNVMRSTRPVLVVATAVSPPRKVTRTRRTLSSLASMTPSPSLSLKTIQPLFQLLLPRARQLAPSVEGQSVTGW